MVIHFNTNTNNNIPSHTQAGKMQVITEPKNININFRTGDTGNAVTSSAPQNPSGDIDVIKFEQKHEAFVHPKYDNYIIITAKYGTEDLSEEIGILTNKDRSVTIVRCDENKKMTFINVADKSAAYKLIDALEHAGDPDADKIIKKVKKHCNGGKDIPNIGANGNGEEVRKINILQ